MNLSNLGITFSTSNSKYFYDTKTEKVFRCEPTQYNILNDILNGVDIYDKYLDKEIEKVIPKLDKFNIFPSSHLNKVSLSIIIKSFSNISISKNYKFNNLNISI